MNEYHPRDTYLGWKAFGELFHVLISEHLPDVRADGVDAPDHVGPIRGDALRILHPNTISTFYAVGLPMSDWLPNGNQLPATCEQKGDETWERITFKKIKQGFHKSLKAIIIVQWLSDLRWLQETSCTVSGRSTCSWLRDDGGNPRADQGYDEVIISYHGSRQQVWRCCLTSLLAATLPESPPSEQQLGYNSSLSYWESDKAGCIFTTS